jgi:hypothetical protein
MHAGINAEAARGDRCLLGEDGVERRIAGDAEGNTAQVNDKRTGRPRGQGLCLGGRRAAHNGSRENASCGERHDPQ